MMKNKKKQVIELKKLLKMIEGIIITSLDNEINFPVGYHLTMVNKNNKKYKFSINIKPEEQVDDGII